MRRVTGNVHGVRVYSQVRRGTGCGLLVILSVILSVVMVRANPLDIPNNAIPLLINPGFETEEGWGWTGAYRSEYAYEGIYSMAIGGVDVFGDFAQYLDVSQCAVDSPIWLIQAYSITSILPPGQSGYDITEGWIHNWQGIILVLLWTRFDYDYTDGWETATIRVDNGVEACLDGCVLMVAASTNSSPESPTFFYYDNMQAYCIPADSTFRVYLPIAIR